MKHKKLSLTLIATLSLAAITPIKTMEQNPYIDKWDAEKRRADCIWWTTCGLATLASFYLANAPTTVACLTTGSSCETINLLSCCPAAYVGWCAADCCCKETERDKRPSFQAAQASLYCCAQAPRPSTRISQELSHDLSQLDRVRHFLAYLGCADERTEIGQQCNTARDKLRSELRNRERQGRLEMQ